MPPFLGSIILVTDQGPVTCGKAGIATKITILSFESFTYMNMINPVILLLFGIFFPVVCSICEHLQILLEKRYKFGIICLKII